MHAHYFKVNAHFRNEQFAGYIKITKDQLRLTEVIPALISRLNKTTIPAAEISMTFARSTESIYNKRKRNKYDLTITANISLN